MRIYLPIALFAAVLIVVDLYAFKSLRVVSAGWARPSLRIGVQVLYWIVTVSVYALVAYVFANYRQLTFRHDYYAVFMTIGVLMLFFVPKLIVALFHLADDLTSLARRAIDWFVHTTGNVPEATGRPMTRWNFLSKMGWVVASLPFLGMLYGMFSGRYAFRVERIPLRFANLPASFNGLKIVHISDIHIGSFFNNRSAVERGIDMINDLAPDIILFTGDMVNNFADETDGWEDVLGKLKAKMGKYSILGNHDYGDYAEWPSELAKADNLEYLKKREAELGFKMLNNAWTTIKSEAGDVLELIGSENWGEGGFSKYGDLERAMDGTDSDKFQILMTHDPSHWDAQVIGKTGVDLTLSGHTHGMQFGVEIPGIVKWSPAKYRYRRWGGLYREARQCLYVNRGFGYIGFPGRVGMPPEITLLELERG